MEEIGQMNFEKLVEDGFCVVEKNEDGKVLPLTTHTWLNSGGSESLYQYG